MGLSSHHSDPCDRQRPSSSILARKAYVAHNPPPGYLPTLTSPLGLPDSPHADPNNTQSNWSFPYLAPARSSTPSLVSTSEIAPCEQRARLFAFRLHHLSKQTRFPHILFGFLSRKDSPQSNAQFSHCLVKLQRINSDQSISTAAQNPLMGRKRRVDNNVKSTSENLFPRKQIGVVLHADKPHSSEIALAMATPNSTGGIQGRKCMQIEFQIGSQGFIELLGPRLL